MDCSVTVLISLVCSPSSTCFLRVFSLWFVKISISLIGTNAQIIVFFLLCKTSLFGFKILQAHFPFIVLLIDLVNKYLVQS